MGINTAEYTIAASCDPQVETGEEVKPVEPSWTIASETEFWQPITRNPVPIPRLPSISLVDGNESGTWTAKVHAVEAGEWKITFTATVTYKLWDTTTDDYARDDKGDILTASFNGEGTCRFKATNGKFRIILTPHDNFAGRSLYRLGVGETATISVEAIDPPDGTAVIASNSRGLRTTKTGEAINVEGTLVTAGDKNGTDTIIVWAKVNNGTATMETLNVEVAEPDGVHFIKKDEWDNQIEHAPPPIGGQPYEVTERGAFFFAEMYLQPTDVSFLGVAIGEGTVEARRSGSLSTLTPIYHPAWTVKAQGGNIEKGCRVGEEGDHDNIGFRWNRPGDGTFIWRNIPWTYQTENMKTPKTFRRLTQEFHNEGNTLSWVSKNSIKVERTCQ